MKRFFILIWGGLILSSCSINHSKTIPIAILDQFDTQEQNEQLGMDLLNYAYPVYLQQEFPDFTQRVLRNITWQYFVQEDNKQGSFRLILSNAAVEHEDKIAGFFKRTVDEQIERQVNDKAIFDTAIEMTLEHLERLDKYEYEQFWAGTTDSFKKITNEDEFSELMESRGVISEIGGSRIFHNKQYYRTLPEADMTGFYTITCIFENYEDMVERVIYHKEGDELKIISYNYNIPN